MLLTDRNIFLGAGVPEASGEVGGRPGEGGLYAGRSENLLSLAQRCSQGSREYPQGGEVLLQRRDAYRQHLGASVQRGEPPFELGRTPREPYDLGADLRFEGVAGVEYAQPRVQRKDRGDERKQRAGDDDDGEERRQYFATLPRQRSLVQTLYKVVAHAINTPAPRGGAVR